MVGLVRDATVEERAMFWTWLCGGVPVAPHLLYAGTHLQADYDGPRIKILHYSIPEHLAVGASPHQAHYVFNPVLIGSELKAMESERERLRRETGRKPDKGRQK